MGAPGVACVHAPGELAADSAAGLGSPHAENGLWRMASPCCGTKPLGIKTVACAHAPCILATDRATGLGRVRLRVGFRGALGLTFNPRSERPAGRLLCDPVAQDWVVRLPGSRPPALSVALARHLGRCVRTSELIMHGVWSCPPLRESVGAPKRLGAPAGLGQGTCRELRPPRAGDPPPCAALHRRSLWLGPCQAGLSPQSVYCLGQQLLYINPVGHWEAQARQDHTIAVQPLQLPCSCG